MHSTEFRSLAKKWKENGATYNEIGRRLEISKKSAINLCQYKLKKLKKKTGPKNKITKKLQLKMKREISNILNSGQKVFSQKIIQNCDLLVSKRTVQRHLKKNNYVYQSASTQIVLSQHHKLERVRLISQWIHESIMWENVAFSDEKRFSLDGPDNWKTYSPNGKKIIRQKRQCHGGGIMVWMMIMSNGLLSHTIIKGKFKSTDYISMLQKHCVPYLKLNFGTNIIFQEDNCTIHKCRIVKDFWKITGIPVLEWPSKSPDINITEDVWKMLSDIVYDRCQYNSLEHLMKSITNAINEINTNHRTKILNLYSSYRHRLTTVLTKRGNLFNK